MIALCLVVGGLLHRTRKLLLVLSVVPGMLLTCFSVAAMAGVLASSAFDTDQEGWRVIVDPTLDLFTPVHVSAGGNPGGFIQMVDPGPGTFYWFAPAQFLGDQSAAFGGQLQFDLQSTPPTNTFPQVDVALVGGSDPTSLIAAYFAGIIPSPPVAAPNWSSYSVGLTASGWTFGLGPPLTDPQMMEVLSNLEEVWIRGEFQFGTDTGGLDNARLVAIPEPSSLALLAAGTLATLGFALHRRRKTA